VTVRHVGSAITLLVLASTARAQAVPELRADAFVGRTSGAQLGVGAVLDAGSYTRLALIVGAGAERRPGGALVGVQRAEGVVRFHFDPLRQSRHGVYVGGGVGARRTPGGPLRALLVAVLGVEGPPHGGIAAAVEAGVGGGARVGVALRRARAQRR
jgi:hypothetical protein